MGKVLYHKYQQQSYLFGDVHFKSWRIFVSDETTIVVDYQSCIAQTGCFI